MIPFFFCFESVSVLSPVSDQLDLAFRRDFLWKKIAKNVRVLSISTDYLVLALGSDLLIKRKIKVFDIAYIL